MNESITQWLIPLLSSSFTGVVAYLLAIRKARDENTKLKTDFRLQKGKHISDVRFDAEFAIFKELSEEIYYLADACKKIFPQSEDLKANGYEPKGEYCRLHNEAKSRLVKYLNSLYRYAPFISTEMFLEFWLFSQNCEYVIESQPSIIITMNEPMDTEKYETNFYINFCSRVNNIELDLDILIKKLRKYLDELT